MTITTKTLKSIADQIAACYVANAAEPYDRAGYEKAEGELDALLRGIFEGALAAGISMVRPWPTSNLTILDVLVDQTTSGLLDRSEGSYPMAPAAVREAIKNAWKRTIGSGL